MGGGNHQYHADILIWKLRMTSETAAHSRVQSQSERLTMFLHALLLVLSFSLVFIVGWGGSVVEKSFAITVTNTGDGNLRFKEAPYIEVLEGC